MQLMLSYLRDSCICSLWVASPWAQGYLTTLERTTPALMPEAAASTLPSGIIFAHPTALMGSFSRRQVLSTMWDGRVKHQADRWSALKTPVPSLQG